MITDLEDPHHCKHCNKQIPSNRDVCYVCDLVVYGNKIKTPKNVHELTTEFMNNVDTSDWEPEDVIMLFNKFNEYVEKRKYRITIQ